ncbi:hypothetical protein B0H16DRAFT_1815179 [Mycena metata]|uniref:Uncharacterized protein n=1 Tax=Mycena metata TaxID=1033252 RepID=A0AAD7JBW1_9AGAR|nr:hypothetical protein B0H16DRAFT_1815179 [Mycena metata]
MDFGRSPKPSRPSLWCTPGPSCGYCLVRLLFRVRLLVSRILSHGYCGYCFADTVLVASNPAPATETHASPADAIFMGSTATGKGTLHSSCRLWGISGALRTTRVMALLAEFGHPRTDPPRNSDLPRCYPASPVPLRALRFPEKYFFSPRNVALSFSQPNGSIPVLMSRPGSAAAIFKTSFSTSTNNKICGRPVHTFCKGTAVQQRAEDWWTPGIFVGEGRTSPRPYGF